MSAEKNDFFSKLEKSYEERCRESKNADIVWKNIIKQFPPDRAEPYDTRPSFHLAKKAGDMGLALIWIVQATLTRPLLRAFLDSEQNTDTRNLIKKISKSAIGALAISEDKNQPLIVQNSDGTLALDGEKKYITGGSFSDFILLAGRYPKEEKLSCMFLLPVRDIPKNAFNEIDIGCFYTTSHARLKLKRYHPPEDTLLSAAPSEIRKLLLIWGIIERSMIMEALAGLAIYLAAQVQENSEDVVLNITEMETGISQISREIDQQIRSARKGDFVQPLSPMPKNLISAMQQLKTVYKSDQDRFSDELLYRFKDMLYFSGHLLKQTKS